MMKWRGPVSTGEACFEPAVVRPPATNSDVSESSTQQRLCEFPTSYLAKLHSNQTINGVSYCRVFIGLRAEAIRRLFELGLSVKETGRTKR